jgi:prophage antirepressor-like protein
MSAALIMREAFEGHPLTFVEFDGQPVVVARELAAALGYQDSNAIARAIRQEWSADFVEGEDFRVLDGAPLRELKALMVNDTTSSIDPRSPSLLVLTESGWWQVAQRTEKALGVRLRRFLTREVLPKLARGEGIPAAGATPAPDLTTAAEHRKMGDRLWRAGDRVGALACYQRGAAALGVETTPGVVPPEPRARRAPPQGEQVPLLPVKAAERPAPTVDEDWLRFVALWRERFGRQRTRASELIALVTSAGLFRKALANRDEHARVTVLGRIIAKHYGRGVKRGKSGEPYVVLATP